MRALRDMNTAKLAAEDAPLFGALVADLFPGLTADAAPAADVLAAVKKVARDRGLQEHCPWLDKCMQLYETTLVRHGIMLVGPSGAGEWSEFWWRGGGGGGRARGGGKGELR